MDQFAPLLSGEDRSTMKHNLLLLTALLLAPPAALSPAVAAEAKPNIVILYADDLGYGDVQCYNPKRGKIPTPNIDKLATQGMKFSDGHSSSGVCSPSRYALLTGRYHWRSRLQTGIVGLWAAPLIKPERTTIASLARQHGYRTACIGKWHLGWDWPIPAGKMKFFRSTGNNGKKELVPTDEHRAAWRDAFSKSIPGGPTAVGFDEYFGTDVPNWPPYCFIENDRTVGVPSEYGDPKLFAKNQASQQGPAIEGWTLEPILPALADRAVSFIKREASTPAPFLLYMPFTSPHTPLSVNTDWKGKSGLNLYADFVMETDAVVGRVLDALEESGAANNTLVVFTSDNGCAPYIGKPDLEAMDHYPSGPLRGAKSDAWEGGHRVPFIVRWPNRVQSGVTCDQLVHQTDLLATFAEIIGTTPADDVGEDSFSLIPLLKGEDRPIRGHAVSAGMRGVPALRKGSWKYIPAPGSGGWGTGGDSSQPVQLYNLSDDIGESRNLAAAMPEKVAEMRALLEKLIINGRSTPGPPQKNDVTVKRFPTKPKARSQK
jgi:arylsulfatase A